MTVDTQLADLSRQRDQLLRDLAGLLTRVGPNHPQRARVNATRSKHRKAARRLLKLNGAQIVNRVMEMTAHLRVE